MISKHADALPRDQSASLTDYDLLVASNISGCEYGIIAHVGRVVKLDFVHTMSMLMFTLPNGSKKYKYILNNEDFTPYKSSTGEECDEYKFLLKPGSNLEFCIKYSHNNKLYKFETWSYRNLWQTFPEGESTKAGHCYYIDKNERLIPYSVAVDMGVVIDGKRIMWSPFNLGAEEDYRATLATIDTLPGYYYMLGVNQKTSANGTPAYNAYNNSFTNGTKPRDLPDGYNYSGDPIYDVATKTWGGKWRTPSKEEWLELKN